MKQKVFLFLNAFFTSLQAMEYPFIKGLSYRDINPDCIIKTSPPMPNDLAIQVRSWAQQEAELLRSLSKEYTQVSTGVSTIQQEHLTGLNLLQNRGYTCLSQHNFIFKIPVEHEDKKYLLRMSGPRNKAINLLPFIKNNKIPTYQTVGQLAYYLRCEEYITRNREILDDDDGFIQIPPLYGIQIPGRSSIAEGATDDNCFLVQEELLDFVPVHANPILLQNISVDTIIKMIGLIKHAGLWAIESNLLIHKQKPIFGMINLKSNYENPNHFFLQNPASYQRDVCLGLKQFIELFKTEKVNVEQSFKIIKTALLKDIEWQQWQSAQKVKEALGYYDSKL